MTAPPAHTLLLADRFELGELIGAGAMGEVYAAYDRRDARPVAVKRLRAEGSGSGGVRRAELVQRFAREGAILRAAAHPNIVGVLAVVDDHAGGGGGGPSIVMERVTGGNLEELLRREPRLPVPRVLALALDLSDALARAHRLGVVHRDLKPANVLLADDGTPRLTDFGIASLRADAMGDSPGWSLGGSLTGTGAVLGTLPYLCPEGWDGAEPDARADVWSLGVMLYEMLAGRRPFAGAFPGLLLAAIATADPPPLRALRPDVPEPLADAIARMLEKDPARRMASVRELGVIAERLLNARPDAPDDAAPSTARRSRPAPTAAGPGAVPTPATPLVGRAEQVAELTALLGRDDARLVTLTGAGGSGKTRLAVEVAHAARDRFASATFVDLTPLADAAQVLPAIAHACGVEEDLYRPLRELVAERFQAADDPHLLVLDNFEHVLGAAPEVAALLAAAPRLTALVTSRFALRVAAEREYPVPPLALPAPDAPPDAVRANEAVALFAERARARDPRFALDADTARAVAAVCRRLDGLPLAIELAAARARVLPPARLLAHLDRPLALLTGGGADRAPHHRTLRAAIAWSHDLLDARERALFRRLAVFVGGWSLDDAEAVLTGDDGWDFPAVVDGLQSLIEKSLVTARDDGGEPRYGMLETLREYARERLAESGDAAPLAERHARHFAALAAAWEGDVPTARQGATLARFAEWHDNLRAALAWGEAHDAALLLRTAGALGRFWYLAGHWHEALAWYARALDRAPDGTPEGTPAARALVLDHMGRLEMFLGDEAAALAHHEEAAALAARADDAALRARTAEGLGEVLLKVGQSARATSLLEGAEVTARAAGSAGTLAATLTTLATAYVAGDAPGRVERAEALLREALALARTEGGGDPFALTKIHYYLAGLALLRGDHAAARELAGAGTACAMDSGDRSWVWHLDEMVGRALAPEAAQAASAGTHVSHSLHQLQEVGSRSCLPHSLEAAARLRLAQAARGEAGRDALVQAAELVGGAEAVCEALAIAMLPVERALLEQTREAARAALGPAAFDAARATGRGWTAERAMQAAELALGT